MKRRRYLNDPPPPGGVSYQHIELVKCIDHMPRPAKTTRLKADKATGAWVIDPDQTPRSGDAPTADGPPAE